MRRSISSAERCSRKRSSTPVVDHLDLLAVDLEVLQEVGLGVLRHGDDPVAAPTGLRRIIR